MGAAVKAPALPYHGQEEAALAPSPLAALHSHRKVLGVIGILHCPSTLDLGRACRQFEQSCKYVVMFLCVGERGERGWFGRRCGGDAPSASKKAACMHVILR